jgi:hypothetical protein
MPVALLYVATTLTLICVWSRLVQRVRAAAALALVLLPLCFTGQALITRRVYAPIDLPYGSEPLGDYAPDHGIGRPHNAGLSDLYMQMIPWQHAVRQSLRRGDWPLWNPHLLAGSVLAANMQSTAWDPLHLVALALPHPQALTFGAAMTFFLAAFFTWAFARALGLDDAAALVAAGAYAFCAPLAFFVGWPLGRAWAYLPFVLLAIRLVVRETGPRAAALLTTAVVLAIVAGHPETVVHLAATGALYGVLEIAVTQRYRAIVVAASCSAVALLLTAVVLLPFLEAVPQTWQYLIRKGHYSVQPLPVDSAAMADRALMSVVPWYGGQPQRSQTRAWDPTNVRVGSVALVLSLLALLLASRRCITWLLAGLVVVGADAGLNAWPLAAWLHAMPPFDAAINERLVFVAAFALAMLAGIAVDAWPSAPGTTRIPACVVLTSGFGLALATLALRQGQIAQGLAPGFITMLTLADLVPLALMASMLIVRVPRSVVSPIVLGLLLLQRTIEDGTTYPALSASAFYPQVPILAHMQGDRGEPFRMVGLHYAFLPDAAALYGLEDVRGYEAMTFRPLVETYPFWCVQLGAWFNNVPDPSRPFLSFLNVKYAIASRRAEPDAQWKLVLEDRSSRLFENTRVLPRAFVPAVIRYERESAVVLQGIARATDFASMAWITAPAEAPREVPNGPGTLRIRRDGSGFDIDAIMQAGGWVVISESGWRGWRAEVDGRRADLRAANHAFLGVHVPSGVHRVHLSYRPDSFIVGGMVSLFTSAGLVVVGVVWLYRGRTRRRLVTLTTPDRA